MDASRGARRALLIVGALVLPIALAFTTSMIVRVSDPANAGVLPAITTSTATATTPITSAPQPSPSPTITASPTDEEPASPASGGSSVVSGGSQRPTTQPSYHSPSGSGGDGGSGDGKHDRRDGGGDD